MYSTSYIKISIRVRIAELLFFFYVNTAILHGFWFNPKDLRLTSCTTRLTVSLRLKVGWGLVPVTPR